MESETAAAPYCSFTPAINQFRRENDASTQLRLVVVTFSKKRDRYPSDIKESGQSWPRVAHWRGSKSCCVYEQRLSRAPSEFFARKGGTRIEGEARERRDPSKLEAREGGNLTLCCLTARLKGKEEAGWAKKGTSPTGIRRIYWEYSWRCKFRFSRWMFYVSVRKMETFRFLIVTLLIQAIKDLVV